MANLKVSTIFAWLQRREGRVLPNQFCGNAKLYPDEYNYVATYGEPGYSDPKAGIWLGNWNHMPKWFCELLERNGYECEWSDEWYICHESGKCYRTSGDSYGWTPSAVYSETLQDMITADDLDNEHYADAFIADLTNSPDRAMTRTMSLDLAAHGFKLAQTGLESGWHPGQDDDPEAILKAIHAKDGDAQVIFDVTSVGQFDARFQVWVKSETDTSAVAA